MVKGWKNSPEWRRYYEAKKAEQAAKLEKNRLARIVARSAQSSMFSQSYGVGYLDELEKNPYWQDTRRVYGGF